VATLQHYLTGCFNLKCGTTVIGACTPAMFASLFYEVLCDCSCILQHACVVPPSQSCVAARVAILLYSLAELSTQGLRQERVSSQHCHLLACLMMSGINALLGSAVLVKGKQYIGVSKKLGSCVCYMCVICQKGFGGCSCANQVLG
jgi:hypothetical protein